MAEQSGSFITLHVEDSGVPGTYNQVGGQRDMTLGATRSEIDVSSKDDPAEKTLPGRLTEEVTLDAVYIDDDAALADLKTAVDDGTQVLLRWHLSGVAQKQATATVLEYSLQAPDQDAAVVSLRLKISGGWSAPS
jgi:TP901-1 family phage major tail protein